MILQSRENPESATFTGGATSLPESVAENLYPLKEEESQQIIDIWNPS